jgi:hypothetical protein
VNLHPAHALALASLAMPAPGQQGETTLAAGPEFLVERVSTAVPFPRGLVLVDRKLFALCRGRVREYGGVSAEVEDQAGTLYEVDPAVAEPASSLEVSEAVRRNGRVLALPTDPPFVLWDRSASPPTADRETDRPYCALRWHEGSQSFFICAFSGIDKPELEGESTFSKNLNDGLLRYSRREGSWHVVERHDIEAGGLYPHHDPRSSPPPHGWLNGPDNCLVVGDWLYAVAKDNSVLVRYDLRPLVADPEAGPPPSEHVLGSRIPLAGGGFRDCQGHSALAWRNGWLYLGFRTTSEIVRIRVDEGGEPAQPIRAELVALFDPYDAATRRSANLTDMDFGPDGALYVISAKPARVHRFAPDPRRVHDARTGGEPAWLDLTELTANPKMKAENVLVDDQGRVYVTSGDAYDFQNGAGGVIYRVSVGPSR